VWTGPKRAASLVNVKWFLDSKHQLRKSSVLPAQSLFLFTCSTILVD